MSFPEKESSSGSFRKQFSFPLFMVFLHKLHMDLCILYLCLDRSTVPVQCPEAEWGMLCRSLASVFLLRPSPGKWLMGMRSSQTVTELWQLSSVPCQEVEKWFVPQPLVLYVLNGRMYRNRSPDS